MVRSSASNSSWERFQRKACNSTRPPVISSRVAIVLRRTKSANRGLRTYHTKTIAAANNTTPIAASIHKRTCERRILVPSVILSSRQKLRPDRPEHSRRELLRCCVFPPAGASYATMRLIAHPCAAGQAAHESGVPLHLRQPLRRRLFANQAATDSCSRPQLPQAERARGAVDEPPRSSSLAPRSADGLLACPG